MSATFKMAKQKQTQQLELRRLMNEHKPKNKQNAANKIDSPLAKYNELGQLTCILCKTVVRSEDVWKVHVNAKQHKQNIEVAKQLKKQTNNFTSAPTKRAASPPPVFHSDVPIKRIKGILKNASDGSTKNVLVPTTTNVVSNQTIKGAVPDDFFDTCAPKAGSSGNFFEATLSKTSIRQDLLTFKRESTKSGADDTAGGMDVAAVDGGGADETLPEGFFDDPVKDAKARHLEYKDPVEEEWERFQKEIKAAADFSNAIIAEDQEEATAERQIDEIDEQIRNWSRVLHLEKKKEVVAAAGQTKELRAAVGRHAKAEKKSTVMAESDDDDAVNDDDDFDEYLDWRAKKGVVKHK